MPRLHLICGMACAGKTTLAKSLEISLSAVRLSPDEWISEILEDHDDRAEMDRLREKVESLQRQLGERLLTLGKDVILENGFWASEERSRYREAGEAAGAEVVLHFLDVSRDELIARVHRRNADLPDGSFCIKEEEIDLWLEWFEPPGEHEFKNYDEFFLYRD